MHTRSTNTYDGFLVKVTITGRDDPELLLEADAAGENVKSREMRTEVNDRIRKWIEYSLSHQQVQC
jgi:hypothetical protein